MKKIILAFLIGIGSTACALEEDVISYSGVRSKNKAVFQTLLYNTRVEKYNFSIRVNEDSTIIEVSGVEKGKLYQLKSENFELSHVAAGSKIILAFPKSVDICYFYEDGKKLKKITILKK